MGSTGGTWTWQRGHGDPPAPCYGPQHRPLLLRMAPRCPQTGITDTAVLEPHLPEAASSSGGPGSGPPSSLARLSHSPAALPLSTLHPRAWEPGGVGAAGRAIFGNDTVSTHSDSPFMHIACQPLRRVPSL